MPHHRPEWFESVYQLRRERTVHLTQAAIDAVTKAGRPVSLSAIVVMSRHIDPAKRGISASALLRNTEAHERYASARTWRAPIPRHLPKAVKSNPFTLPIKLDRRVQDARRRLARLSKPVLIDKLLELQNAYAVVRDAWLQTNAESSHRRGRKSAATLNTK